MEIQTEDQTAEELKKALLKEETPIVVRIAQEKVLIDMRTVGKEELPALIDSLAEQLRG